MVIYTMKHKQLGAASRGTKQQFAGSIVVVVVVVIVIVIVAVAVAVATTISVSTLAPALAVVSGPASMFDIDSGGVSGGNFEINSNRKSNGESLRSSHTDHNNFRYWSLHCPSPTGLVRDEDDADSSLDGGEYYLDSIDTDCCCSITDYGAIGDNSTLNTVAIQSTIDTCHETCLFNSASSASLLQHTDATGRPISSEQPRNIHRKQQAAETAAAAAARNLRIVVYVPNGMYRTGSLSLRSNTRFHIGRGAALYGSDDPRDYPMVPMLPNGYQTHKTYEFRALISGYNIENVSVTGENYGYPPGSFARFSSALSSSAADAAARGSWNDTTMSVIDGVGWKWWCRSRSMPIPQSYCQHFNPHNETMPDAWERPKLIEFYNSTNIVLDRFTARNSPFWFLHPFLSKNISMTNLTLLAPREVGNTDGLDPDSCENVVMDSCYIDVGDDGVSIKSTNHSGTMAPTRNITMRNLWIVSRNWCIGSATFGGVYDILFEDSTIGDPQTVTSPWAIKFKSHRYYPGPIENVTIRRIEMGKIGPTPWMYPKAPGSAFLIGLSYGESPSNNPAGKPLFRNVTIEDISVVSAGVAGQIRGLSDNCLEGLSLRNITVFGGKAHWACENIDLDSLTVSDVHPPVSCKGGCSNAMMIDDALLKGQS